MKGLVVLLVAVTLGERGLGDVSQEAVTCDNDSDGEPAARLAMQHINKKHHHGYKFKLSKLHSFGMNKNGSVCMLQLNMDLQETSCHVLNPKPFEECQVRRMSETQVKAECNVTISVAPETPTAVSYVCNTEPMEKRTLARICPDCSTLMPLHHPDGLDSVKAAVAKFNREGNHTYAFKLLEVGRLRSGWFLGVGRSEYAEFAIVETDCPAKARVDPRACKSLCPDRARHGYCKSSLIVSRDVTVDCDIYDAKNSTQPSGTDPNMCKPHMGHGPALHPPQHPHHGGHGPAKHPPHYPWHEGHGPAKHPTQHPWHEGHGPAIHLPHHPHHGGHGPAIHPPQHPWHEGHRPSKPPHHERDDPANSPTKPPQHGGHDPANRPTKPPHDRSHGLDILPPKRIPAGHEIVRPLPPHPPHALPPHPLPPHPLPVDQGPVPLPFTPCHGFVKIPPSIYPICPFPHIHAHLLHHPHLLHPPSQGGVRPHPTGA